MEDWENEEMERLSHYVEIGAVELAGVAEDGEFIYKITQRAREVAPELWEAHEEHIDNSLLELYEMGMMRVSYDEELNATIELTEVLSVLTAAAVGASVVLVLVVVSFSCTIPALVVFAVYFSLTIL